MGAIRLFGIGLQGKSPTVSAQRRINCYYDLQPQGDKTLVAVYGTPGLQLFTTFGDLVIRGEHYIEDTTVCYIVYGSGFWEMNASGIKTLRGTLSTSSGRVCMDDNGAQILVVDGTTAYVYTIATHEWYPMVDVDFPYGASMVTYQDSYFIVSLNNHFYISAPYEGKTWDGTDFAAAESSSDNIVRPYEDGGQLIIFGRASTEFWSDTGATDFPYQRIPGSSNKWGLAAKWSIANFQNAVVGLFQDPMGQVSVCKLVGYTPQKISNAELETNINRYTTIEDATAFSYVFSGHAFYQINFPSADVSWLYDGNTNLWSQVQSNGIGRHRADRRIGFTPLSGNQYCGLVIDFENGYIYKLLGDVYSDNGEVLARELVGQHVVQDDLSNLSIDCLRIDMETGVGLVSGQGSDPQVMLSISRDGGRTWEDPRTAAIGALGNYRPTYAEWRRLGAARDWLFKLRMTDPVKFAISNTIINPKD